MNIISLLGPGWTRTGLEITSPELTKPVSGCIVPNRDSMPVKGECTMKISEFETTEEAVEQTDDRSEKTKIPINYKAWENMPATAADMAAAGHY